jgi:hypothetical protein
MTTPVPHPHSLAAAPGKDVEFYELTLKPNALVSSPHYEGTREFLTIEEGSVRLTSGDETRDLKETRPLPRRRAAQDKTSARAGRWRFWWISMDAGMRRG